MIKTLESGNSIEYPQHVFMEKHVKLSQLMRLWYLSHGQPVKAQANSEGSGKHAHPSSLARAFAVRLLEVWK